MHTISTAHKIWLPVNIDMEMRDSLNNNDNYYILI